MLRKSLINPWFRPGSLFLGQPVKENVMEKASQKQINEAYVSENTLEIQKLVTQTNQSEEQNVDYLYQAGTSILKALVGATETERAKTLLEDSLKAYTSNKQTELDRDAIKNAIKLLVENEGNGSPVVDLVSALRTSESMPSARGETAQVYKFLKEVYNQTSNDKLKIDILKNIPVIAAKQEATINSTSAASVVAQTDETFENDEEYHEDFELESTTSENRSIQEEIEEGAFVNDVPTIEEYNQSQDEIKITPAPTPMPLTHQAVMEELKQERDLINRNTPVSDRVTEVEGEVVSSSPVSNKSGSPRRRLVPATELKTVDGVRVAVPYQKSGVVIPLTTEKSPTGVADTLVSSAVATKANYVEQVVAAAQNESNVIVQMMSDETELDMLPQAMQAAVDVTPAPVQGNEDAVVNVNVVEEVLPALVNFPVVDAASRLAFNQVIAQLGRRAVVADEAQPAVDEEVAALTVAVQPNQTPSFPVDEFTPRRRGLFSTDVEAAAWRSAGFNHMGIVPPVVSDRDRLLQNVSHALPSSEELDQMVARAGRLSPVDHPVTAADNNNRAVVAVDEQQPGDAAPSVPGTQPNCCWTFPILTGLYHYAPVVQLVKAVLNAMIAVLNVMLEGLKKFAPPCMKSQDSTGIGYFSLFKAPKDDVAHVRLFGFEALELNSLSNKLNKVLF